VTDTRARTGFLIITAVRFLSIALIMLGFAIVRGVIGAPWEVGVAFAVFGFLEFFFLPRFIARRFRDDHRP
jgi:pilus assembly protein TadC